MAWRIKDAFAIFCMALFYLSIVAFGLFVYYVPKEDFVKICVLLVAFVSATFLAFFSSKERGCLILRLHSRIFLSRLCFYGMFFAIGFLVSATEHLHALAATDKESYYRYEFLFGSLSIVLSCAWLIWLWALFVHKMHEVVCRSIRSLRFPHLTGTATGNFK